MHSPPVFNINSVRIATLYSSGEENAGSMPGGKTVVTSKGPKSLPFYAFCGTSYGCSNFKRRYIGKDRH